MLRQDEVTHIFQSHINANKLLLGNFQKCKEIKNRSILQSLQILTWSRMQLTFVFPFFLLSGAASLTARSCCLGFFSWFRSLGIHYHLYIFLFGLLHCLGDSGYPSKKKNTEREERNRERDKRERIENSVKA